jgi:hypothetical protein
VFHAAVLVFAAVTSNPATSSSSTGTRVRAVRLVGLLHRAPPADDLLGPTGVRRTTTTDEKGMCGDGGDDSGLYRQDGSARSSLGRP